MDRPVVESVARTVSVTSPDTAAAPTFSEEPLMTNELAGVCDTMLNVVVAATDAGDTDSVAAVAPAFEAPVNGYVVDDDVMVVGAATDTERTNKVRCSRRATNRNLRQATKQAAANLETASPQCPQTDRRRWSPREQWQSRCQLAVHCQSPGSSH